MSFFKKPNLTLLLRAEGLFVLLLALVMYSKFDYSWSTFFIFFLVPDLSFFGYLKGDKIGAIAYNTAHSYAGPLVVLLLYILGSSDIFLHTSIIWFAHIGFDRALGYGLKYSRGFSNTHLGLIGKAKNEEGL